MPKRTRSTDISSPFIWLKYGDAPSIPIRATSLSFQGQPVIIVSQLIDIIKSRIPSLQQIDSNLIIIRRQNGHQIENDEEISSIVGNTETTPYIISFFETRTETRTLSSDTLTAKYVSEVTGASWKTKEWKNIVLDENVETPIAFKSILKTIIPRWILNSDKARRFIIDLILTSVVSMDEFKNYFGIECEYQLQGTNEILNKSLNGAADYVFGHKITRDALGDLNLVALQARIEWPHNAWVKCFGEAALLYKQRVDYNNTVSDPSQRKNPAVWGIYSNAQFWQFLYIDNEGNLFKKWSHLTLSLESPNDDNFDQQLDTIVRHIHFIMTEALRSSPRASAQTSLEDLSS